MDEFIYNIEGLLVDIKDRGYLVSFFNKKERLSINIRKSNGKPKPFKLTDIQSDVLTLRDYLMSNYKYSIKYTTYFPNTTKESSFKYPFFKYENIVQISLQIKKRID